MSAELRRSDDELINLFYNLTAFDDVADILEIPSHQLAYILYKLPENQRYTTYNIRKRNGKIRIINAPCRSWKILQQKLSRIFQLVYRPRKCVYGFIASPPKRTIVTNAQEHSRSRFVFNLDLKDFFPSIHFGRIRGMLIAKPYSIGADSAKYISHLCCCNTILAQGSPVSPIISNMICARLDGELIRFAKKYHCKYTRYCDDITFSTSQQSFPEQIAFYNPVRCSLEVGTGLVSIISYNGFSINEQKTRLQHRRQRQIVTGLTVNRKPNVTKKYKACIRAMLHAWEIYGYANAQNEYILNCDTKHRIDSPSETFFADVVQGKINFMGEVCGKHTRSYRMLNRKFRILQGYNMDSKDLGLEFDVFLCHASEDKASIVIPIVKAFAEAGIKCWLDENEIKAGDDIIEKINHGLSNSTFTILIISEHFLRKRWPQKEMNSVLAIEFADGIKRVIPIIVGGQETIDNISRKLALLTPKRHELWRGETSPLVAMMKDLLGS